MIELTKEELWGFNIINSAMQSQQQELQRTAAARDSYIKLLEGKYDAIFNPISGMFEPKPEESKSE